MELTVTSPSNLIVSNPTALDQNPAAVYLAGLANDKARRVQAQALSVVAEILTGSPDYLSCNWAALNYSYLQAVRARLAERYAAATANRTISAIRGVLKAAFLLGQMAADTYQKAIMIKNVTGQTLPAGRELASGELAALVACCENDASPAGVRDAAIIALAYSCGLRRDEITSLDFGDYDQVSGRLIIHGKRNKERSAYLINGAARAMADWLTIRGAAAGALFFPVNKGGVMIERRMTNQAIYNLLSKRGAEAGVRDFSPHDLRRTFVSDLLEAGADIATVARMAGHASVTTTARYDRRPEQAKQKAAGLLHVPYRGRLVR
jgi:site-specific recombinase XerD